MISKWFELKDKALKMRKMGISIGKIEAALGIPRSTLHGWFKSIRLSYRQKQKLQSDWRKGLILARKKAIVWHNDQKAKRLQRAEELAANALSKIDVQDRNIMELSLAMLYLGEGFKKDSGTGIGNSDPKILIFFITLLKTIFEVTEDNITCYLHLRADQDEQKMKQYWSTALGVPVENFRKSSIDLRTKGKASYESYKGVCVVRCNSVAIQRKLVYLSRTYCERIINNQRAISSFG